jgi:hypothetical protein
MDADRDIQMIIVPGEKQIAAFTSGAVARCTRTHRISRMHW